MSTNSKERQSRSQLHVKTKAAALKWVADHKKRHHFSKVQGLHHIYPRCYVVGKAAPGCLIVALPWMDSEPHLRESHREDGGLRSIHAFDESLKAGDWCAAAYAVSEVASGLFAFPAVEL